MSNSSETIDRGETGYNFPYFPVSAPYIEINKEEKFICYRETSSALVLALEEPNNEDILCCEECWDGEAPLYFTLNSHFISPAYRLNKAKEILIELLTGTDYQDLRIKLKIIYSSPEARLKNEAELQEYWKELDLEVLLAHQLHDSYQLPNVQSVASEAFPPILQKAIQNTSITYSNLDRVYVHSHKEIKEEIKKA